MTEAIKMENLRVAYLQKDSFKTVDEMVLSATDILAPVWPIKKFIACNPLQGLEDLPFETALAKSFSYQRLMEMVSPERDTINREMIKWLLVFLDEGQSTIAMPNKDQGFYQAFSDLARYDSQLMRNSNCTAFLSRLPDDPRVAITECFQKLAIPESDWEEFIRQSLAALPGWSGYIKWRTQWQNPSEGLQNPISLTDYIAVRMVMTVILWPNARIFECKPVTTTSHTVDELKASEQNYRNGLLGHLLQESKRISLSQSKRPEAQLVFCIDVRSEPFRRNLEKLGHYQTYGFAGFFGVPVRIDGYDDLVAYDSCPVLIKPCHEVHERPVDNDRQRERYQSGRSILKLKKSIFNALKYNFSTPFALVEMMGAWLGAEMLLATFAPSLLAPIKKALKNGLIPEIETRVFLDSIPVDEQAQWALNALRSMGLTENMAPLVVFCGHGSSSTNNPYAAALNCGACGSNRGGQNARLLAAILNQDDVRSKLAFKGLVIPEDTLFLAAEHNTTTDQVQLLDCDMIKNPGLEKLKVDLDMAGRLNSTTRCLALNASSHQESVRATLKRSVDWAETRPEWGLARNAAFIVGPRELTGNMDLEGRCFLHSYNWIGDKDGEILQSILCAPMVVAQWINSQYLFSAINNVAFGSGSKLTKNVSGKIGVMQGNASDLMHGLPLQSIFSQDDKLYHEPLRLLTVVYAPQQTVDQVVRRNLVLQKLFYNGWVTLAVIDPNVNQGYLLDRNGQWRAA